ncbi:hypothetical protein Mal64_27820 [Pseudobythopirellula maris]|uniref:Uncharacterized protein n=1 Tax=Pseudobythopirellula maris TaxID=2527991 RepID=A0A5C5ZIQ5_9BACT|nr:hypothetical protein [Pseudobythopirellula maris]TWT87244.1 hypothetical protein Mal64_27820 [Pseudobythopirellula maris]
MQISLPDDADPFIRSQAEAAGFKDDIAAYVVHLIAAQDPDNDPRGPLSEEQLQDSLQRCDRAMAQARAGKGKDLRVAIAEIADKHGLDLDP